LLTRVVKRAGAIVSAHVGGGCVQMMEGSLYLAGES
jgi:trans-2,3-dihydro-3-hydroxyanthranilate isomerase